MKTLLLLLLLVPSRLLAFDCSTQPNGQLCGADMELNPPACSAGVCMYPTAPDMTGSGTISSSGATVTGSSSDFVNQINVGWVMTAGGQNRLVKSITSATSLTTADAFTPALAAGTTYTVRPPIGRWDDANGTPLTVLTGDGRLALTQGVAVPNLNAMIVVARAAPASVSSGNGVAGVDVLNISAQQGGDTTAASAVGGIGGGAVISAAPSGSGPGNGTAGNSVTVNGGGGGATTAASGKTGGVGGAVILTAGQGGSGPSSNTNGNGGDIVINGGTAGSGAGTAGSLGNVLIQTSNGGPIKGGINSVAMPRAQVFSSTSDANIASVTDIQLMSASVLTESGRTESIHASVRLNNASSGGRTYTCTIRRGGSSCTISSTLVTDSQGSAAIANATSIQTLNWNITEASPGTGTTSYYICCKSSSATGTQTTEYQQLDVFEF